jgi:hypothetical protein
VVLIQLDETGPPPPQDGPWRPDHFPWPGTAGGLPHTQPPRVHTPGSYRCRDPNPTVQFDIDPLPDFTEV